MHEKYLDHEQKFIEFFIGSKNNKLDEMVTLQESRVEDAIGCIDFLTSQYDSSYADYMFNLFIEVCLLQGVHFINTNKELISEIIKESYKNNGDSNGNEDIKKD